MRDGPVCCFRRGALRGVLEQDRVRVVDVDEYLAFDAEVTESGNDTIVAGHAHMTHAASGLAADTETDHLVIAPQCAIEEDERGAPEALRQGLRHCGAARNEEKPCSRRRLGNLQADCSTVLVDAGFLPRLLEPQRNLARDCESRHR